MLQTEQQGDVTLLRLTHGKASVLDLELLEGLTVELGRIAEGPGRALVVTGTGSIFSAGVDLFRVVDGGAEYLERFLPALDLALERLLTFPRPTVAAVNGHAIAGGCILALACDRQVAARGPGRMGVPELLVGVPFPPLPLEIVRDAVPTARLAQVVYGGATYEPDEAQALGLVGEVVEPDQLLARALALAETHAALDPEAFALVKRQLRAPLLARVAAARPIAGEIQAAWAAPEARERIRGYLARTVGKKR
jgi:enoyl-CoA hydratase